MLDACFSELTTRRARMLALASIRSVPEGMWAPQQFALLRLAEELLERADVKVNSSSIRKRLDACWVAPIYDTDMGQTAHAALAHLLSGNLAALFNCVSKMCSLDMRMSRISLPLCALMRDIVGNPFRPVVFSPEWRTDTAVTLARQMYESREFGAMPILADALQDAGCDNDDILSHCRDTSLTHVRGCWVTDLVLGKA
jgi:hypothetical protein